MAVSTQKQYAALDGRLVLTLVAAVVVIVGVLLGAAAATGSIDQAAAAIRSGTWPLAATIALAALGALAGLIVAGTLLGEAYTAILWLLFPFVPGAAATLTVLAYLLMSESASREPTVNAVFVGSVAAAAIWVVAAIPLRDLSLATKAQSRGYSSLHQRSSQLRARLQGIEAAMSAASRASAAPVSSVQTASARSASHGPNADAPAAVRLDPPADSVIDRSPPQKAAFRMLALARMLPWLGGSESAPESSASGSSGSRVVAVAIASGPAAQSTPSLGSAASAAGILDASGGSARLPAAQAPIAQPASSRAVAGSPASYGPDETIALDEARRQLDIADGELAQGSQRGALRWVTGGGYVAVSRALHRAEEALIEIEPIGILVGDALHDDLSIAGSTLQNAEALRGLIRESIVSLSPGAARRLFPEIRPVPAPEKDPPPLGVVEARAALHEVRQVVNDLRDGTRDGFIRARSRVLWAVIFVSMATYLLLGLAVVEDVQRRNIVAASTFYLVGAIVGLFNRLRIEGASSAGVEDYGLFQARLIHTPVISGLAAVAGVFLVAAAPSFLGPVAATTGVAPAAVRLTDVFDLTLNQAGLIVAAIFGLTPSLLTRGLQDQVAGLERTIRRSEPAAPTETHAGGTAAAT